MNLTLVLRVELGRVVGNGRKSAFCREISQCSLRITIVAILISVSIRNAECFPLPPFLFVFFFFLSLLVFQRHWQVKMATSYIGRLLHRSARKLTVRSPLLVVGISTDEPSSYF
jgi:hypothetical protein